MNNSLNWKKGIRPFLPLLQWMIVKYSHSWYDIRIPTINIHIHTTSRPHSFLDSEINQSFKDNFGKVWIIVVFTVSDFVLGDLFSHILASSLRCFRSRKSQSNTELQTPENNLNYQDLDITKMNAPENYESLTMNVVSNGEESENDPTYAQLSTTRDDENNYQALT